MTWGGIVAMLRSTTRRRWSCGGGRRSTRSGAMYKWAMWSRCACSAKIYPVPLQVHAQASCRWETWLRAADSSAIHKQTHLLSAGSVAALPGLQKQEVSGLEG